MCRRPAGLADELELGQPLDHRTRESRTLLGEHNNLRVFQSLGEVRCVSFGIRVNDDLMAAQCGIALKRFECVLIIIDDCDLHESFLLLKFLSFSLRKLSDCYSLRTQPRSSRRATKGSSISDYQLRVLRGPKFNFLSCGLLRTS